MKIIYKLIDTIFPPRPDELKVRQATSTDISRKYLPGRHENCLFLSSFSDPLIKACIFENKFHNNRRSAKLLSQLLVTHFSQMSSNDTRSFIIAPIPLGKRRLKERGYNQVERVISAGDIPIPVFSLLRRTKETEPQTGLDKTNRNKNLHDAFTAKEKAVGRLRNTTIYLVDDVLTTGATLQAGQKALETKLDQSCQVVCLALAH